MGRRSSGGGRSMARRPSKPASKSTAPAPIPTKDSPPVTGGSIARAVGSAVVDGIAWGGGNAVAHRVMDSIMGPRVVQVETVAAPAPVAAAQAAPSMAATPNACVGQNNAFQECLNTSGNDISRCQFYMDMLAECRKSGSSANSASMTF